MVDNTSNQGFYLKPLVTAGLRHKPTSDFLQSPFHSPDMFPEFQTAYHIK
ncbi:MAG: hypothetical protein VXY77_04920 [Pseudomonadota bacterium]|nr:hypothetical protein [Pseudomonadota bacterium]